MGCSPLGENEKVRRVEAEGKNVKVQMPNGNEVVGFIA
jgi:hypothetical protein